MSFRYCFDRLPLIFAGGSGSIDPDYRVGWWVGTEALRETNAFISRAIMKLENLERKSDG